jgi:low affinity Fe/Cu permease
MQELFRKFANKVSNIAASVYAFGLAIVVILAWSVTGPVFGFSDTWQLIINTGTTIVTFLMVFLIQNTQNRDNTALHAKLDELIVHTLGARNKLATAEDYSEEELKEIKRHFEAVAEKGGSNAIDEPLPTRKRTASASRNGRGNGRRRAPAKAQ